MSTVFLFENSTHDIAIAVGIDKLQGDAWPECKFMVGDIVTFPQEPRLAFRVTQRWMQIAADSSQSRWSVRLASTPMPV